MDSLKVLTERGGCRGDCLATMLQLRTALGRSQREAQRNRARVQRGSFPRTMVTYCPSHGAELGRGRGSGGQSLGRSP